MKKLIFTVAILMTVCVTNAQTIECNGGERVEYVGLYSYKDGNGRTIFKMATEDWTSMQEYKKAKKKYGFRLESTSNSTAHKQHKLKNERRFNVDSRRFLEKVMNDNVELANNK